MIKRGEIYFASLDPVKGREQAGKRPILVVSSDTINAQPLVITVVAGTDSKNLSRDYPTNIRVTAAESDYPRTPCSFASSSVHSTLRAFASR
jgi:mRNA interferase MazF